MALPAPVLEESRGPESCVPRDQPALRRSAESTLATFGGVEYDEAALMESEERYRDYASRYPAAADRIEVGRILDGIQQKRAEKTAEAQSPTDPDE